MGDILGSFKKIAPNGDVLEIINSSNFWPHNYAVEDPYFTNHVFQL